jgi:hypothetical protein
MGTTFNKEKAQPIIVMSRAIAEESMPLAFKTFKTLFDSGIIDIDTALNECDLRNIFKGEAKAGDFLNGPGGDAESPFDGPFGGGEEEEPKGNSFRVRAGNVVDDNGRKHGDNDGRFTAQDGGGAKSGEKKTKPQQDISELLGQEYTGVKGQNASDKLLQEKGGHVKGAFERRDIGKIDLAWGDDSFGLKHIMQEREARGINPHRFVSDLAQVVERGKLQLREDERYVIRHKGKVAIITPELRGNKMTLLLTAFTPD